jgi:hypothetical protein
MMFSTRISLAGQRCVLLARRSVRDGQGVLDSIGYVPREIVGRSKIASKKTYIAVDQSFPNNIAVPRAELAADPQFRSSA